MNRIEEGFKLRTENKIIGAARIEFALRQVKVPRRLMVRRLIETETDFDQFSDRHQAAGNLPDLNIGADIESAFRNALSITCFENKIVDILKKAEKSNINIISHTER